MFTVVQVTIDENFTRYLSIEGGEKLGSRRTVSLSQIDLTGGWVSVREINLVITPYWLMEVPLTEPRSG